MKLGKGSEGSELNKSRERERERENKVKEIREVNK